MIILLSKKFLQSDWLREPVGENLSFYSDQSLFRVTVSKRSRKVSRFWNFKRNTRTSKSIPIKPQVAQSLSMNHGNITIWRRIVRVCMGFSTRHPWRQLKITILNKNGLPYAIRVLFAPGGVIIPI